MIIVNLKGGLGNQMFQYALGYVLAKKKNCDLFCDIRLQEFYKKNPPPRNVPREIDLDIFGISVKQPSNWVLLKVLQNFSIFKAKGSSLTFNFVFEIKIIYRVNFSVFLPGIIN